MHWPLGILAFFLEKWCCDFRLVRSSYLVALSLLPCLGCPRHGGVNLFLNSACGPRRCQEPSWKVRSICCQGLVSITLDCTTQLRWHKGLPGRPYLPIV